VVCILKLVEERNYLTTLRIKMSQDIES